MADDNQINATQNSTSNVSQVGNSVNNFASNITGNRNTGISTVMNLANGAPIQETNTNPSWITDIYNNLAQVPQQAANVGTTQLGNSQAARGLTLAQMGASGGNGVGAYTYNRLVNPVVHQLADDILVEGRRQALNRAVNLGLRAAKEAYERIQEEFNRKPELDTGTGPEINSYNPAQDTSAIDTSGLTNNTSGGINEISNDKPLATGDRYSGSGAADSNGFYWIMNSAKGAKIYVTPEVYAKYISNPQKYYEWAASTGVRLNDYNNGQRPTLSDEKRNELSEM